jgi:hypothetical protein
MAPLPEDPTLVAFSRYWRTPRCGYWGPGCVPSWGLRIRQAGLIGDKILPARGYRDGGRDWCGLILGLVLFRFVVSSLQPVVVRPYPVRGTWFPNRLSLEGTRSYLDFLGRNRQFTVPGVQDPYNILT